MELLSALSLYGTVPWDYQKRDELNFRCGAPGNSPGYAQAIPQVALPMSVLNASVSWGSRAGRWISCVSYLSPDR
jgi:hypothetical protein